ncbi:hypothetical protein [Butyricimonas sp.]|uniref:hypothetical protein n=1 Tax=Butyricimonas sp. TaxID=1969738 RepID=UPI0025BE14BE|nr:hypothetical protein [Butyricimonas sp.]
MNKLSKYNYFIPEGNRVIYFNGISNEVFSLSQQEHEKMQSLLKERMSLNGNILRCLLVF